MKEETTETQTDTTTGAPPEDTINAGTGEDTVTTEEGNDGLEHPLEGLADHPEDPAHTGEYETTGATDLEEAAAATVEELTDPDETVERAEAALAAAEGPQHGTHDAAMRGLQTDASGSTPPKHPRGPGYE